MTWNFLIASSERNDSRMLREQFDKENERIYTVNVICNQHNIKIHNLGETFEEQREEIINWIYYNQQKTKEIKEIFLKEKNISQLPQDFFHLFPSLQKVDLSYNSSLDPDSVHAAFRDLAVLLTVHPYIKGYLKNLKSKEKDLSAYTLEKSDETSSFLQTSNIENPPLAVFDRNKAINAFKQFAKPWES